MSYNRQPVAEDPMQIWGAVGVLLILLLFVIWLLDLPLYFQTSVIT